VKNQRNGNTTADEAPVPKPLWYEDRAALHPSIMAQIDRTLNMIGAPSGGAEQGGGDDLTQ
jgi:hypothetical protein